MSQKPDNPPGQGGEQDGPEYIIDETVTVPRDNPVETWDLEYDPSEEETHVIRAIARTNKTNVQASILPKEELDHFENGENVWTEYESKGKKRLKASATITHTDEKPFYHDGDYVLAVKAVPKSKRTSLPGEPKFSVKYRRE